MYLFFKVFLGEFFFNFCFIKVVVVRDIVKFKLNENDFVVSVILCVV